MKKLPEIPKTWLLAMMLGGLMGLRAFGIDTFVTAGLSAILGWIGHDTFLKKIGPK